MMFPHVIPQIDFLCKRFVAKITFQFLAGIMDATVFTQIRGVCERFVAHLTNVIAFIGVRSHVNLKLESKEECEKLK